MKKIILFFCLLLNLTIFALPAFATIGQAPASPPAGLSGSYVEVQYILNSTGSLTTEYFTFPALPSGVWLVIHPAVTTTAPYFTRSDGLQFNPCGLYYATDTTTWTNNGTGAYYSIAIGADPTKNTNKLLAAVPTIKNVDGSFYSSSSYTFHLDIPISGSSYDINSAPSIAFETTSPSATVTLTSPTATTWTQSTTTVPNSSTYINALGIPYQAGSYTLSISDASGILMCQVPYTITQVGTANNTVSILGATAGGNFLTVPSLTVSRSGTYLTSYDDVFINGTYLARMNTGVNSYSIDASSTLWVLGTNNVVVKDSSGTQVASLSFSLLRPVGTGSTLTGGSGPPNRANYTLDVWGAISWFIDTMIYYITYPFTVITQFLSNLLLWFGSAQSWIFQVTSFFTTIFSFLPAPIVQGLTAIFSVTVIFTIFRIIRR